MSNKNSVKREYGTTLQPSKAGAMALSEMLEQGMAHSQCPERLQLLRKRREVAGSNATL